MPAAVKVEPGDQFGRWTVIQLAPSVGRPSRRQVVARCACGTRKVVKLGDILYGQSKSCGCLKRRRGAASPNWRADRPHPAPIYRERLRSLQGGACSWCARPLSGRVEVDHDHTCCPGRGRGAVLVCAKCVRALVHAGCNKEIGHYERGLAAGHILAVSRARSEYFSRRPLVV